MSPEIVAPQGENKFILKFDEPHKESMVREYLGANYFIDRVSTRNDAKVVKNYGFSFPNKEAALYEDVLRTRPMDKRNELVQEMADEDNLADPFSKNYGICSECGTEYNKNNEFHACDICHCGHRIDSHVWHPSGSDKTYCREPGCDCDQVDSYKGYVNHEIDPKLIEEWSKQSSVNNRESSRHIEEYKRKSEKLGYDEDHFNWLRAVGVRPKDILDAAQRGYDCVDYGRARKDGNSHEDYIQKNSSVHQAVPYHVSPVEYRESIEEHGLLPGTEESNKWPSSIEPLVYMSPTDKDADLWGFQIGNERHSQEIKSQHEMDRWNSDDPMDYPELEDIDLERQDADNFDLWHVNTEGLPVEERPTDMGVNEIISREAIPPKKLTHIKEFWASANNPGYEGEISSELGAPTDEDPQYIIGQSEITDPQRTASKWYEG
jgi:hypothetical protein